MSQGDELDAVAIGATCGEPEAEEREHGRERVGELGEAAPLMGTRAHLESPRDGGAVVDVCEHVGLASVIHLEAALLQRMGEPFVEGPHIRLGGLHHTRVSVHFGLLVRALNQRLNRKADRLERDEVVCPRGPAARDADVDAPRSERVSDRVGESLGFGASLVGHLGALRDGASQRVGGDATARAHPWRERTLGVHDRERSDLKALVGLAGHPREIGRDVDVRPSIEAVPRVLFPDRPHDVACSRPSVDEDEASLRPDQRVVIEPPVVVEGLETGRGHLDLHRRAPVIVDAQPSSIDAQGSSSRGRAKRPRAVCIGRAHDRLGIDVDQGSMRRTAGVDLVDLFSIRTSHDAAQRIVGEGEGGDGNGPGGAGRTSDAAEHGRGA